MKPCRGCRGCRASKHQLAGLKFTTINWKEDHKEVEVRAALGAQGLVMGETYPRDCPPPCAGQSAQFLRKNIPNQTQVQGASPETIMNLLFDDWKRAWKSWREHSQTQELQRFVLLSSLCSHAQESCLTSFAKQTYEACGDK